MDVVVQYLISVFEWSMLRIWTECLSRRKRSRCVKSSVIKFTWEQESISALPSLQVPHASFTKTISVASKICDFWPRCEWECVAGSNDGAVGAG